ncbi:hypothetical protein D3C80_2092140 [compost metagenome]
MPPVPTCIGVSRLVFSLRVPRLVGALYSSLCLILTWLDSPTRLKSRVMVTLPALP